MSSSSRPRTPAADWWQQVDDPELASLEQRALAGDLDLQIALQRVRAARAVLRGAELDYAPHIPLDAAYTHSKEQQPGFGTDRIDIQSYSVGFDASWELDLFGRTRRAAQAASADLGAQAANLDETRVIVAAEVARNYFELRGTQRQLAVAHDNMDNQREALRLTQVRYEAGRVTELDVDSALARLKTTEATLPLLEAQEKSYGYRLAVLLGIQSRRPRRRAGRGTGARLDRAAADRRCHGAAAPPARRAGGGAQFRRGHRARRRRDRGSVSARKPHRLHRLSERR